MQFPDPDAPDFALSLRIPDLAEATCARRRSMPRPQPGTGAVDGLQPSLPGAVNAAERQLVQPSAAEADAAQRLDAWWPGAEAWSSESDALVQRADVKQRRERVAARNAARRGACARPSTLVRPLLVVVPRPLRWPHRPRAGDRGDD